MGGNLINKIDKSDIRFILATDFLETEDFIEANKLLRKNWHIIYIENNSILLAYIPINIYYNLIDLEKFLNIKNKNTVINDINNSIEHLLNYILKNKKYSDFKIYEEILNLCKLKEKILTK